MEVLGLKDISVEDRSMFLNYFSVEEKMKRFSDHSTPKVFKFLFGESEGERLWSHFTGDCDRIMSKFKTYLTADQKNVLYINAVKQDNMYYLI